MHVLTKAGGQPTPPASWLAVGSLSIGAFALVTSEFLPVSLLPRIADDLGASRGEIGLMVTIPGFLAALSAPLGLHFAGGVDRRRVLWILLVMLVASNLIVASASSLWQLLAGRILLGIAVGSFWTIAGSLGPKLRSGADGVRASAVILSGVSIGTVVGVPAGALAGELFGWRLAFVAAAIAAAAAVMAILRMLPSIPGESGAGLRAIPSILTDPRARLGLFAAVLCFNGQFAAYTYVTPFLDDVSGIGGGFLSALLLANGIAGFLGNLAGGWLSARSVNASLLAMALLLGGSVLALWSAPLFDRTGGIADKA